MVTPEDLRRTSLLAFLFSLVIAAVFQFAGLPPLASWSMILGGFATFIIRWYAVKLADKQHPVLGTSIQTSLEEFSIEDLPPEQRQLFQALVREELEQIKEEQRTDTPTELNENEDEREDEDEDREFETETN